MGKTRPKIFCQFHERSTIEPISGDRINELRFYRALSTFADVYYNDCLIDWDKRQVGDPTGLNPPSRDYDLYYVRANTELFLSLPSPKITMAYPHDDRVFEAADALVVTTRAWQTLIKAHPTNAAAKEKLAKWYPETTSFPDKIVNVRQTIDPQFIGAPSDDQVFKWKARLTGARAFGFFGRVSDETLPSELFDCLDLLREESTSPADPIAAVAGSVRTKISSNIVNLGRVDYPDMPALLAACRGTLGQYCADSDFLGSGKILDAMAAGIPIVSRTNDVRTEQLGEGYPGIYHDASGATDILRRLIEDDAFHANTSNYLLERAQQFTPEANGQYIKERLAEAGFL